MSKRIKVSAKTPLFLRLPQLRRDADLVMMGFTLVFALGFAGAIFPGATGATRRTFTTAVGKAKADKQDNQQEQWCDIALHPIIIALQSP